MSAKIIKLVQVANPAIKQVLEEFLSEQGHRLKPKSQKQYDDVIELLQHHLDAYAHQGLSKTERTFFEKHFDMGTRVETHLRELLGTEDGN